MNIDYVYKQNEKYAVYEVGSSKPIIAEPDTPEYTEVEEWIARDPEAPGTPWHPKIPPEVAALREAKLQARATEAEELILDMAWLRAQRKKG